MRSYRPCASTWQAGCYPDGVIIARGKGPPCRTRVPSDLGREIDAGKSDLLEFLIGISQSDVDNSDHRDIIFVILF